MWHLRRIDDENEERDGEQDDVDASDEDLQASLLFIGGVSGCVEVEEIEFSDGIGEMLVGVSNMDQKSLTCERERG